MPASGLTGVGAGVGGGGGGGEWTRATLTSDYNANTTALHTLPESIITLKCKALYRCRGLIRMKNNGAGTISARAYVYSEIAYTAIQGVSAGNNQYGTLGGTASMTTTILDVNGFYGGHTAQATFECLIATDNTATGTTDIGLQVFGNATNNVLALAGSFIEVQEIT